MQPSMDTMPPSSQEQDHDFTYGEDHLVPEPHRVVCVCVCVCVRAGGRAEA